MNKKQAISLMRSNNSQLCIGLDLNTKEEDKLGTALEIIDTTHDLAAAYKPNRQYWMGFSIDDMKQLTDRIRKYNCFSIIDHKLSDIGSSNEVALQYCKAEGFDFITVSPFPGNMEENSNIALDLDIGLISLVLMSNPTASWMKISKKYRDWAEEAELFADGIVVGTTNHVTTDVLQEISILTPNSFVLAPGIGKQGGNADDLKKIFGERVLFNVSRGISQAENVRDASEEYYAMINK